MRITARLRSWIRALLRRERAGREMDAELRSHIELHAEDLVRDSLPREEALRQARLAFGGLDRAKEECRDATGISLLESLAQDLRFALRMLRKNSGFAAVAILTLALGIGANTAIFSVVDAVLLRSLPYPDANRLVVMNESLPRGGRLNVSMPDFLDWQAQSRSFDQMAAYSSDSVTLTGAGDPQVIHVGNVSWSFFPLLDAKPFLGRTFSESEDKPGAAECEGVITYALWRNKLGGDPNITGKTITLDGYACYVVGVLPPDFSYPGLRTADLFAQIGPLAAQPGWQDRSNHPGIKVLARLKAGESLAAAQSDMDTIMARLGTEYPKSDQGERAVITPLYALFLGNLQPLLLTLFGAAGLVLLLACVNVANLFLSRGISRHREISIRAALGARRVRLVRQLLTESVLLSLLGGAAGALLAFWTIKPLLRLAPASIPNIEGVQLNLPVLLFTILAAMVTGILFGLVPSLQTTRPDLTQSLKQTAEAPIGGSRQRLRSALLITQVALATTLVVASGLLIRSFASAMTVDPGFNPDHMLALDVILSNTNGAGSLSFYNQALDRIRALPGVESADAAMQPPVDGFHWTSPYMAEDHPAPSPSERPWTAINMVTPGYFHTMQTRLLAGRFFTEADDATGALVIIINQTFAERLWPGESALGKQIYAQGEWRQVVGVVADLKQAGLTEPVQPETFLPFAQMPVGFMTIVVRTPLRPSSISHAVIAAIQASDKDLPVSHVVPMAQYVAASVESRKFSASLLGLFGSLALLLAAIGTYATVAYNVSRRVREVGIRMALGASRPDVLRLVLGSGMRLVCGGVALGVLASLGLTRSISNQLYDVRSDDPLTFAGVSALLLLVAALACYIPARRATRIDPVTAMRCE